MTRSRGRSARPSGPVTRPRRPTPRRWSRCGCVPRGSTPRSVHPELRRALHQPRAARTGRAGRGRPGGRVPPVARHRTRPARRAGRRRCPGRRGRRASSTGSARSARPTAPGPFPELWRIGTGRLGGDRRPVPRRRPAARRVAPAGHLDPRRPGDAPRRSSRACCMRVLSHFRPGLVALHVWDVGQLTGALPGLYPLTRTGLLTVHDPSRLAAAAGGAVRPHPPGAHPGARRRPPVAARARRGDRCAATSRGSSPCWSATGRRCPTRTTASCSGSPAAGWPAACTWCCVDVPMAVSAPVETVRPRATTALPPRR